MAPDIVRGPGLYNSTNIGLPLLSYVFLSCVVDNKSLSSSFSHYGFDICGFLSGTLPSSITASSNNDSIIPYVFGHTDTVHCPSCRDLCLYRINEGITDVCVYTQCSIDLP